MKHNELKGNSFNSFIGKLDFKFNLDLTVKMKLHMPMTWFKAVKNVGDWRAIISLSIKHFTETSNN
jgi:hypothetical protein